MGTLTRLPSLALCLVGAKIGRMENRGRKIGWKTVFSTVWQKKENREEEKPRRKFSLLGPQFSSSQIGRKMLERKVLSQHFYTNALSFQRSQQLSKEEEDNFPTTNSAQPNYHDRNPKITQNQHKTT